jgi:septum formation protein
MPHLYPHLDGRRIVLASQSPRRRELMSMMGLDVECMARDIDESWPVELEGVDVAAYVAKVKAEAYLDVLGPGDVLITGDTVVVLNGKVLEKPENEQHACDMLRALSGQTHTVASAVAVTTLEGGTRCALDLCHVTFDELTDDFIEQYVATGSPMDKAGAYGVQDVMGLVGVTKLDGSFYTVMGMPTHRLHTLLLEIA